MKNIFVSSGETDPRHKKSTCGIPAVSGFIPERYLGKWYEAARITHIFERGIDYAQAEYSMRKDGTLDVLNSGVRSGRRVETHGVARFKNGDTAHGELEVSFFRPFYAPYRIIALADDYSSAVVTSGTKDYLWILSRAENIDEKQLGEYLSMLSGMGFETSRLEYRGRCL